MCCVGKEHAAFLRTSEFLLAGRPHRACHKASGGETRRMLGVYVDFAKNVLAIPRYPQEKRKNKRFAGAMHTYTMEA
jgi:prolyl-tRNA synthetase